MAGGERPKKAYTEKAERRSASKDKKQGEKKAQSKKKGYEPVWRFGGIKFSYSCTVGLGRSSR